MGDVRFLSPEANQALQEQRQATDDLHRLGYSVRSGTSEPGFWLVIKPQVYQARKHPFLEMVCDPEDLPKVRDWLSTPSPKEGGAQ